MLFHGLANTRALFCLHRDKFSRVMEASAAQKRPLIHRLKGHQCLFAVCRVHHVMSVSNVNSRRAGRKLAMLDKCISFKCLFSFCSVLEVILNWTFSNSETKLYFILVYCRLATLEKLSVKTMYYSY